MEYSEKIAQLSSRNQKELVLLKDQLAEADTHKNLLQIEMQQMREKLDTNRMETIADSEETISELKKKYEREKAHLVEENKKLVSELEGISDSNKKMQSDRLQMENDYEMY